MPSLDRRQASAALLQAAAVYQLCRLAFGARAFAKAVEPLTERWLRAVVEIAHTVKSGVLPVATWQTLIESLNQSVPLPELLTFIDFDRIIARTSYPQDVAAVNEARLPKLEGLPVDLGFHSHIFAYRKGAATIPHVHNNLVSSHLVLRGTLHARTFDRVEDEAAAVILKPSIDREIKAGETISMSDVRDNGHWLVATSEHAYTLDMPVFGVNLGKEYALKANAYGQIFVDPTPPPRADGTIRAPVLSIDESKKKFGGV